MKLYHLVLRKLTLACSLILTVWAAFFYFAMIEEVNDEVDDSLEDYSEWLIVRALSGEELPSANSGSNNQYYMHEVSESYAMSYPHISYHDEMVYIDAKGETEPARVLMTIFEAGEGKYMELTVYTPTIEKFDLKKSILGWIVFLYVLLLLVIMILNILVFKRNMKPLYKLLGWLEEYRLGHKNRPLENSTKVTEFQKLNEAVLQYSKRSEQLYEQQKLFIGNASHEMQTPLAVCRNRLEMLMEDETLSERQLSELVKTHQTLENLTRLNKSLLLLCKIENHQFVEETKICFNNLVQFYLSDFEEVYGYRKINVSITEENRFCVEMNESLASVLVANLLKNSFVHNIDGGAIYIRINSGLLEISNTGAGTALDGERVFERFYQGEKKEGSTGLGLALVSSICKVSGLSVAYSYCDERHIFKIFV